MIQLVDATAVLIKWNADTDLDLFCVKDIHQPCLEVPGTQQICYHLHQAAQDGSSGKNLQFVGLFQTPFW